MTQPRHNLLGIHGHQLRQVHRVRTLHKLRLGFIAILIVLTTGGGFAVLRKHSDAKDLAAQTQKNSQHYASTVHPQANSEGLSIALPATLMGQIESPISARASGYLLRWTKDIGSTVKKGDLLAEISSPELEQQLNQAQASKQQLQSALSLAKITLDRWHALLDQKAVSQQEFDERRSSYEQALSNLNVAEANVLRLKELLSFTRIIAPFDGVITRRNVNIGDLIDAGSSSSKPLFILTQSQSLRAYVYVPQAYAKNIKEGQAVTFRLAEVPNRKFSAVVTRTARAIDPASRSLQVEISVSNPSGELLPGSYIEVQVAAHHRAGIVVPVNTLLLRGEGPRVAVVDAQGKVSLKAVELGKDFGAKVEVLSGVSTSDEIVLNPSDNLSDGDMLTIVKKKP
jgi:RND family efflux transporter MFP subunit